MTNTDKPYITPTRETAESPDESTYIVAVNDQGQNAVWPAELVLPAGWRQRSAVMPRRACLAAIAAAWPDITPVSVREAGQKPQGAPGRGAEPRGSIPHEHNARYVHDLFGEQASRRPHSAAVVAAGNQLTYRQLDQSANQLAHHLQGMGVGPETLVGVCLERGTEAIRCLLAVLKAGGAYLPLDPSLPAARLTQMCAEARPTVILVSHADARAFSGTDAWLLVLEECVPVLADQPATAPDVSLHAENLAYALYTSGSTGQPKAVAVSHGSLACVSQELSREYQISPSDRVLQLASLGFDTSVEQILVALTCGATLMLPAAGTVAPTDLLRYLAERQVTVIDLTPAYWHQMLALTEPEDERLRSVRLMITGGDRANPADCHAAMRAAPGARFLNAYGLTETTITSTLFDAGELVTSKPSAPVPAGKPIRHSHVLVLDQNLTPVPTGELGEIFIGGCGVARGYLGRPELTAELFLPNGHGVTPGSRMYRTGDLGRWRADHQLEVTGRVDRQVKIRGFRVEPAEIESALVSHPDIAGAVVIAHEFGLGNRQLVAYYTGKGRSDASLRAYLRARVPGFMVPGAFIALDHLPLTRGGKVDRRALPPPGVAAGGSPGGGYAPLPGGGCAPLPGGGYAPLPGGGYTPLEAGMSHLWSGLLKTGRVGLDDDFFQLGGNSLLAAEMLARVRVMFGIGANYVRPLTRRLLRDATLRGFSNAAHDARAGRLTGGAGPRVDFTREAELVDPVRRDAGPPPDWQRPREILLTGSTGFLGIHLLRELLTATAAQVHCLVRARDAAHARRRIVHAAERYEAGDLAMDRVVPVVGDLAEPDLGLSPGTFSELARTIDIIYHAGAIVNFIYPYEDLRAANVTGTRELIRLAGLCRGIPIHYVSTTTVLAGFGAMGVREVTEDTPLAYADQLCMGYIQTKFAAEELLRNAGRAGLPVAIYRPLDIVGGQRNGAWNTATEMCALIRFITDTGVAPDIDLPLDFAPADICAAAIRHISAHAEASGRTYHLASPKYALLGSLVGRLRSHGFAVTTIPYREWVDELLRYAAKYPAHPMTPFVPLFVDLCEETGLTVAEMYLEHIFPSYTRSHTEQALGGSGIAFPPVDEKLLDLNIDRLIATGYLKSPDFPRPGQRPGVHAG